MRILQTCFSRSWGGLEIQALEVTRALHRRGHKVWLACCPGSRLQQAAGAEGISSLLLPVRGYFHPAISWTLSRFLVRESVEVIHCQLSKDIAIVVPAMRWSRRAIPVFLSKRVGSFLEKRDLLHRYTYAGVRKVIAVSSVIRQNVLDTTPVPPERVVTLHDAVDTELFSPARADGRALRREFGIADSAVLVGFAGRFSPGKGHEEFLRAAALLRTRRSDIAFLVVGEASYGEEEYERTIRTLSRDLALEGIVQFAGFRREMPEVMAAFDIFAFPSHAESFGVALIEAMAMERPVVSTDCDGVVDIMMEGTTGLSFPPRNPEALASVLERLIDDPSLRRTMGKAGRERVLAHFDRKAQITALEGIYREALDNPGMPPRSA